MPPRLYTSPFPSLELTLDERERLYTTATTLIEEMQSLYEIFLWVDHKILDGAQWSLVKVREDVRVYHGRRSDQPDMHTLVTVGTLQGTLNDAMYGVLNHTTDDMRIKTAYVEDTLIDCAVLETIVEPSIEEPFESMTVRWCVKGIPFFVRPLSKSPDNVYLEATGIKTLSNGEQAGYHLAHSVSFDKTPSLPQYDRYNMSMCSIWRQATPEYVETFTTTYVEIKDMAVPSSIIIKSAADALVSLWKIIECAHNKKLAYLVHHKHGRTHSMASYGCSVCGRHSRSVHRRAKSTCAICDDVVCKKCSMKRKLALLAPDGHLLWHKMQFCIPCVSKANCMDAMDVAQANVMTSTQSWRFSGTFSADSSSYTISSMNSAKDSPSH